MRKFLLTSVAVAICFVLTKPFLPAEGATPQHAGAVYSVAAGGFWIVATIEMGDPKCYAASIQKVPAPVMPSAYRVTIKSIPHSGVCAQLIFPQNVAAFFRAPQNPGRVSIQLPGEPGAIYSVGVSDPYRSK